MLVERSIIGRFTEKWLELKDSRDIVEWTYDVSRNSNPPSGVWSLHSSLHKNTTESRYLVTLGRRIISGGTRWGTLFKINGEWSYIPLYWEWLEDVLSKSRKTLNKARIYDAVSASLYTYDRNADVISSILRKMVSTNQHSSHITWRDIYLTLGFVSTWQASYLWSSL